MRCMTFGREIEVRCSKLPLKHIMVQREEGHGLLLWKLKRQQKSGNETRCELLHIGLLNSALLFHL
jgi:hypothetical protein